MKRFLLLRATRYFGEKNDLWLKSVVERSGSLDDEDLDELRKGITGETILIMRDGLSNVQLPRILVSHPYVEHINQEMARVGEEMIKKNEPLLSKLVGLGFVDSLDAFRRDWLDTNKVGTTNQIHNHRRALAAYIQDQYQMEEHVADLLTCAAILQETAGHYNAALERYGYRSNKNTSMMMDLHYLTQLPFSGLEDMITISSDGMVVVNPLHMSLQKFLTKILNVARKINPRLEKPEIPPQTFLGSSYQRRTRISKEDAVELLKSGCSPIEIADCYGGFTKMQLAALKAHYVTMGKTLQ
jgi:uncharacterized protein (DUF433 family)